MEEWKTHGSSEEKGYYRCHKVYVMTQSGLWYQFQQDNKGIEKKIENSFNSNESTYLLNRINEQKNNIEMSQKLLSNVCCIQIDDVQILDMDKEESIAVYSYFYEDQPLD